MTGLLELTTSSMIKNKTAEEREIDKFISIYGKEPTTSELLQARGKMHEIVFESRRTKDTLKKYGKNK